MILITGATGFLGDYIVDELLKNGEQIRILARNPSKAASFAGRDRVDIAEGDLLDHAALDRAMEGVTKVIHAAAVVSFWPRRYAEMKEVNVRGTELLVDVCLEHGVQKLLHVSSVAAIGRSELAGVIDEKTKWTKSRLNTRYGRSKYLAEMEVHRGVEEGLEAVMCNPGLIMGPGDWNSGTPRLFRTVHQGLKYYNGGTAAVVAATDVARAIYRLLHSDFRQAERFVLVAQNVPYKDLFAWIAEDLGVKAPRRLPPRLLMKLAARLLTWRGNLRNREPLITPETVRISGHPSRFDGSKITRSLDFSYSDVRETVRETARQYLQEHGSKA